MPILRIFRRLCYEFYATWKILSYMNIVYSDLEYIFSFEPYDNCKRWESLFCRLKYWGLVELYDLPNIAEHWTSSLDRRPTLLTPNLAKYIILFCNSTYSGKLMIFLTTSYEIYFNISCNKIIMQLLYEIILMRIYTLMKINVCYWKYH